MINKQIYSDGTEHLCSVLYGKVKMSKVLGGAEAQMLHDAANKIIELKKEVHTLEMQIEEMQANVRLLQWEVDHE